MKSLLISTKRMDLKGREMSDVVILGRWCSLYESGKSIDCPPEESQLIKKIETIFQ